MKYQHKLCTCFMMNKMFSGGVLTNLTFLKYAVPHFSVPLRWHSHSSLQQWPSPGDVFQERQIDVISVLGGKDHTGEKEGYKNVFRSDPLCKQGGKYWKDFRESYRVHYFITCKLVLSIKIRVRECLWNNYVWENSNNLSDFNSAHCT